MPGDVAIDELLRRWEDLRLRGQVLSAEELCRDCPEHLEEVGRRIRALLDVGRLRDQAGAGTDDETRPDPEMREEAPPHVEGYEVLGEVGRGGMGVVYRARHPVLKRLVALKVILAGGHAGPVRRKRFLIEAEALARLHHPNVVQIYSVHEHAGCPCLCLEFVDGPRLADRLADFRDRPRDAAHLVEVLARAVHFAHQRGIVHRDLKPGNVLLQPTGCGEPDAVERAAVPFSTLGGSFVPKLTDFGLAKRLDGDGPTASRAVIGTPPYMAPEQASRAFGEIGPATDVYALGVVLYELLTGRPPFDGDDEMEVLQRVQREEPVPPSRSAPGCPRDLQTICLTCLRKEPARRYASALDLADDLHRFLGREPIRARPAGAWARAVGWAQRRPVLALLLGASGLALVDLLAGGWWLAALTTGLALAALLAGSAWYNARLRAALRDSAREHRLAERAAGRLHLLLEAMRRLMRAGGTVDVLHTLGETATRLTEAECATIYVADGERRELWSQVVVGTKVDRIVLPYGVGIAGTVAETGELINVGDVYGDPRFHPDVDRRTGYKTRSLLTVPVTGRGGRVVGVFQVLNRRDGPFGPEDESALRALAASVAVVLEGGAARRGPATTDETSEGGPEGP